MSKKKQITKDEQTKDYVRLQKEFLRYVVKYNYMIEGFAIYCHDGSWAMGVSHKMEEIRKIRGDN